MARRISSQFSHYDVMRKTKEEGEKEATWKTVGKYYTLADRKKGEKLVPRYVRV